MRKYQLISIFTMSMLLTACGSNDEPEGSPEKTESQQNRQNTPDASGSNNSSPTSLPSANSSNKRVSKSTPSSDQGNPLNKLHQEDKKIQEAKKFAEQQTSQKIKQDATQLASSDKNQLVEKATDAIFAIHKKQKAEIRSNLQGYENEKIAKIASAFSVFEKFLDILKGVENEFVNQELLRDSVKLMKENCSTILDEIKWDPFLNQLKIMIRSIHIKGSTQW
ncbi:MAG: hypothetical protein AAF320_02880 [Myxococcota bacterium]